jgi:hypothetical protein
VLQHTVALNQLHHLPGHSNVRQSSARKALPFAPLSCMTGTATGCEAPVYEVSLQEARLCGSAAKAAKPT